MSSTMAASSLVLTVFAIVLLVLPSAIRATEYIVGDGAGWTPDFDYAAWAKGKEFRVGDKLVFRYPKGYHNVYKVGAPEFQACHVPLTEPLATGNDVITLATAGKKWYICGKANGSHCMRAQKLAIDVLPPLWSPSSAPAPSVSVWAQAAWSPSTAVPPSTSAWDHAVAPAMASASSDPSWDAPAMPPSVSGWDHHGAPAMSPSASGWDPNAQAPSAVRMAPSPSSWSRKLLVAKN